MTPSQTAKSAAKKAKKEKVFHPDSRKAHQLARKALRKGKLGNLSSKRSQKHDARGEHLCMSGPLTNTADCHTLADIYGFLFHALPEHGVLSLEELHGLIRDVWLARHDSELENERATRRKGRPKSVKETKLEDTKLIESESYRTGMEVLDLTHPMNVHLFRQWDQKEVAYVDQLRHVRVFSRQPEDIVVSRPGKHQLLIKDAGTEQTGMQVDTIS